MDERITKIPDTNIFVSSTPHDPERFFRQGIETVFAFRIPEEEGIKDRFRRWGINLVKIPIVGNNAFGIRTMKNFLSLTKGVKGKFAISCLAGHHTSCLYAGIYLAGNGWPIKRISQSLDKAMVAEHTKLLHTVILESIVDEIKENYKFLFAKKKLPSPKLRIKMNKNKRGRHAR